MPLQRHWLFSLLLMTMLVVQVAAARTLTVGVYQNEPKIFFDEQGRPSGLFVDLLTAIAREQGWSLEFQSCNWTRCLRMLNRGELDLMPDVAYSDARADVYDFHRQPALNSWSQLYARADASLVSIFQLENRRVAVLDESIQEAGFTDLLDGFGVNVTLVGVDSYPEAFRRVQVGEVDAAITNHQYGALFASRFELVATPIVFQPVPLYFATGQGLNPEVLSAIDMQLSQWRLDPDSVYFDILDRWQTLPPKPLVSPRLIGMLVAALVLLFIAVGVVFWLRRVVADRTRDLRQSEQKLATILDSVGAFIYIKDRDGRYVYANKKVLDNFKLTENELIGKDDSDVLDAETARELLTNDRKVIADGQPLSVEEQMRYGQIQGTYVSVKIPLRDSDGQVYALCGISTDITEQKQREQKIHQLAYYDSQTGLPNRAYLFDHLEHRVRDRQSDQGVALLVIDIDHFKNINDYHGHEYGDDLLREVSRRLQSLLSGDSHLIHLGADEFVILATGLESATLNETTQRLCDQVLTLLRKHYAWDDFTYHCTASVGAALSDDASDYSLDTLMKQAELAMHQAKKTGRGRVCFYSSDMQTVLQSRMELEADMRVSIHREDFFLVYQPQVDANGRIIGAEALLRWQHPQRGVVSPGEFIPVAESSGLIQPLGRWVLKTACSQLHAWSKDSTTEALTLSVNVSAWQFRSDDFVASIEAVLHLTGARPERLKIELTESMLIDDLDDAIDKITALKDIGVQVALDDFGTGYSSLAYLKRLPLAQLKIDQSFVADILTNSVAGAIARTIIGLGHSLEVDVIAEGVETEAQKDWLAAAGCLAYQGYLFGRPDSADALLRQLSDDSAGETDYPSVG
ncbi:EAL domain-containing protein [Saccharospirillum salsuginis]|uniref:cyclic-guanylate-specific phosphodiesterase n=1 Tax=Saccharospirillum salsuginis TaxID=418750 RepID=A0A918N5W0_9GAMM|nr:EAL domain-containing protein [Saccharospirillum salsuginis]GGX40393.1 hypothetical protein GCM10007392_03880 [Saccharospirillum salsuginis]